MKKIISTLCILFIAAIAMAQAPDVMNYQAVARNSAGAALANQSIRVRLSIMKNAVQQYSETRQVTTNALGLFNVQIGSAGALATTGTFSAINWQNNAAPGYVLKVELDINSSGVFTDMGSQALVTVPYAFNSKTADIATETVNIDGRPIAQGTTPTIGSRLSWDGSSWTPVKKDTVLPVSSVSAVIVAGGSNPPWVFAGTAIAGTKTVTVTGKETIVAVFNSALGHSSAGVSVPVGASVCYQNVSGGAITEFNSGNYPLTSIIYSGGSMLYDVTMISASGAVKLPAGTYKIGLGVKNYSNIVNLSNNGPVNGFIEVKY